MKKSVKMYAFFLTASAIFSVQASEYGRSGRLYLTEEATYDKPALYTNLPNFKPEFNIKEFNIGTFVNQSGVRIGVVPNDPKVNPLQLFEQKILQIDTCLPEIVTSEGRKFVQYKKKDGTLEFVVLGSCRAHIIIVSAIMQSPLTQKGTMVKAFNTLREVYIEERVPNDKAPQRLLQLMIENREDLQAHAVEGDE